MNGYHKHKCHFCGEIWEHSDAKAGDRSAHTCQSCGRVTFDRHYGSDAELKEAAYDLIKKDPILALKLMLESRNVHR